MVLGEVESGELLALKRVPPVRGRATHTLSFKTPDQPGECECMERTKKERKNPKRYYKLVIFHPLLVILIVREKGADFISS